MSQKIINTSIPLIVLLILCIGRVECEDKVIGKVVQIQPVALDVILSIYDKTVVFFTDGVNKEYVEMYQNSIRKLVHHIQPAQLNKTLFAICDLAKDHSHKLDKYGGKPSIQIITPVTNYELLFPINDNIRITSFFVTQFPQFFNKHTASKSQQITLEQLKNRESYKNGYTIFVSPTEDARARINTVYQQVFDFLNFFDCNFAVNKQNSNITQIVIYLDGQKYAQYPKSAVDALFNFTTQPAKHQINDFVDFVNIETIQDVTTLNDQNYYRVFGSSIQTQILLVYRSKDKNNAQIQKLRQQYGKAAIRNRKEGLKYERILFAQATTQFLHDYFSDELLTDPNQLYSIIITKTDYSKFQFRKFIYPHQQVSTEKLIQFIEDVQMKRLDASYKSEEVVNNEGKKIRKIVGNSFEQQIFENPDKSVMVLFIDSKVKNSSTQFKHTLQAFVHKYYEAYKDHMNVGIFDLAKNQHKLLTINSAPQLVLFQRSNKKKPKFFQGKVNVDTIKNWFNYEMKDVTIPQNFGQPPIALGGNTKQQQL